MNCKILRGNYGRLKHATDQDGKKLEVIPFPMPDEVGGSDGRLPASYANFYIANQVVLVPVFGSKNDKTALAILKELFPKRDVIAIFCEPLVWGLGAIHCLTQQEPAT
ncbi:MAG: agmatine deiminase family protein [Candidatus Omnitrophica bacterium]|nr:agmatine deiminase family protein [Candidatus Omnitrophota bacterium]